MIYSPVCRVVWIVLSTALPLLAEPVMDPIPAATIPAGKSLIIPITAASPNGRPLTFTATSSTNGIAVILHTNNPFWKMSVAQAAAADAPGAFPTPFRGGVATVTNVGDMTFMLFRDVAPHTVDVIQGLTAGGLYTSNTIFHRVVNTTFSVIQGGDPGTNGMGGPVFRYDDEFNPLALFSGSGQLALANSGKDTDGSQFFITFGPQRLFDFGYTIFGQLLRGFDVLTNILNTPTNSASRPLADAIITRASFVPDTCDTVLTLTGTNVSGVAGTIRVIADDGAGGRATNFFTATTVADGLNDPPFLNTSTLTNLVIPVSGSLTGVLVSVDLEGSAVYYGFSAYDVNALFFSSMASFNRTNGQFVLNTYPGYSGPFSYSFAVSANTNFAPFDSQTITFAVGDTRISAAGTNFVAAAQLAFTNQMVATFTNGVPNSAATNFTAFINWGDNAITSGLIQTNTDGWKQVFGAHAYTNAGAYPVYVTIQSQLGAAATAVSTANVPPSLALTAVGTNRIVAWPAWATEYQLQSATNFAGTNWQTVSNFPALNGYSSVVTNSATNSAVFFRLKK